MTFRKATTEDINAIDKLFYELETHAIDLHPNIFQRGIRSDEYLAGIINDETSDILLAVIDGDVIGFSVIFERAAPDISAFVPRKHAFIQDFVVTKKYRNKGIGAALMEQSKLWARERGLDSLRLSVLAGNTDGRRFYENQGLSEYLVTMECSLHD